jgi:hypothetical protein
MVEEILVFKREEKEIKKGKLSIDASLFFVTLIRDISNYLVEDLEQFMKQL